MGKRANGVWWNFWGMEADSLRWRINKLAKEEDKQRCSFLPWQFCNWRFPFEEAISVWCLFAILMVMIRTKQEMVSHMQNCARQLSSLSAIQTLISWRSSTPPYVCDWSSYLHSETSRKTARPLFAGNTSELMQPQKWTGWSTIPTDASLSLLEARRGVLTTRTSLAWLASSQIREITNVELSEEAWAWESRMWLPSLHDDKTLSKLPSSPNEKFKMSDAMSKPLGYPSIVYPD